MSDGTFQLKVFSGRGLEVEAIVSDVTVPSESGELGFLQNHCDYVGLIATGITQYTDAGGSSAKKCLVSGGICTFNNNVLTLLADTVDKPEEIAVTKVSDDELALLEAELEQLSLYDPAWEVLSQKVSRLQALKTLTH
jgi:F0F1-type ATP synthase epsilon subunit